MRFGAGVATIASGMLPTSIDGPVTSTGPIDLPVGRGSGSGGAGLPDDTGGDPGAQERAKSRSGSALRAFTPASLTVQSLKRGETDARRRPRRSSDSEAYTFRTPQETETEQTRRSEGIVRACYPFAQAQPDPALHIFGGLCFMQSQTAFPQM